MKVALFLPGRIAAVLLASLVLVLLSFNVAAVEATDFADGYTSTAALKGKFGAAKTLNVADKQTAYVQFALDTLPANLTGAEIRKATLRLWVANVTKEGSITVRQAGNGATPFAEATIDGNTAPVAGADLESIEIVKEDARTFLTVDVTNYLKSFASPSTALPAFVIAQTAAGRAGASLVFDSKESVATSHTPQLQIVLAGNGAQGAAGPAGPAGPQGQVGPAGPLGPQGTQGPQGGQGAIGPQGLVGPAGPLGPQGAIGPQGPIGTTGLQGPQGPTGDLNVYGNGSQGSVVIASNQNLDPRYAQFTNLTINAGMELNVPSGTVIRCTGTFTNNGQIRVGQYAGGGAAEYANSGPAIFPHPGCSKRAASNGQFATTSFYAGIAPGGVALSLDEARTLFNPGPAGGGGGGGAVSSGSLGGGGTLSVRAAGSLTNNGFILAGGGHGSPTGEGGCGGGIVVLASRTSVQNSGTVSCFGGWGAGGGTVGAVQVGPGGGGGGGIIHFTAPFVTASGTQYVVGGLAAAATSINGTTRVSGGGGGACGGNGGAGAAVPFGNPVTTGNSQPGADGHFIFTQIDPTPLLR